MRSASHIEESTRRKGDPDRLGLGRLARHDRLVSLADRLPPALDTLIRPRRSRQRRLVTDALNDPALLARFRAETTLPVGYGVGLDERVIEHPWVLAQESLRGRVLDAGSALNHPHVLSHLLPRTSSLHIATLAPERRSYPERHLSYVYADLRDLPYRDRYFDTVLCISTLEHVGMDNRRYGAGDQRADDPQRELTRALRELERVVSRPGTILLTVPYGERADLGWLRQLDRRELGDVIEAAAAAEASISVYAYSRLGWQLSDLDAAATARYRHRETEPDPPDLASNARAVACVRLTYR